MIGNAKTRSQEDAPVEEFVGGMIAPIPAHGRGHFHIVATVPLAKLEISARGVRLAGRGPLSAVVPTLASDWADIVVVRCDRASVEIRAKDHASFWFLTRHPSSVTACLRRAGLTTSSIEEGATSRKFGIGDILLSGLSLIAMIAFTARRSPDLLGTLALTSLVGGALYMVLRWLRLRSRG